MSALLTPDTSSGSSSSSSSSSSTALIGAPGPFTWRGAVFAVSTGGDFLFRDKTHYHTPVRASEAAPVDRYSYLGMSVAAGNFLPPHRACGQRVVFAAGAPRAGEGGKVVLFAKCQSELLSVQRLLHGGSFASSFGYSLAAVDVDGDGFKELVVGAPFYGTGGTVYVYAGGPDGLAEDAERIRLKSRAEDGTGSGSGSGSGSEQEEALEGRFGLSVAFAGDLNADGAEDLVVGAPYDGRGKVFVYMGSSEHGWNSQKRPDQVRRERRREEGFDMCSILASSTCSTYSR